MAPSDCNLLLIQTSLRLQNFNYKRKNEINSPFTKLWATRDTSAIKIEFNLELNCYDLQLLNCLLCQAAEQIPLSYNINELPYGSVSKPVVVQSLCYENDWFDSEKKEPVCGMNFRVIVLQEESF